MGLTRESTNDFKLVRGKGCPYCNYTGYWGRTAVYEFLKITPEVKKLIFEGADIDTLRREAAKQGMKTLRESAIEKLRQGVTTIEGVLSVTLEE